MLEKFAEMTVGTAMVAAALGVALLLVDRLSGLDLPVGTTTMVHLCPLGLVFGTLALAISAATGHSGVSRAVAAAVAVVAYVVNGLAPLVDSLEPLQKPSPFYQYVGHDPFGTGLNGPAILVSCATVAVLLVVAVLGFRRRDVPG